MFCSAARACSASCFSILRLASWIKARICPSRTVSRRLLRFDFPAGGFRRVASGESSRITVSTKDEVTFPSLARSATCCQACGNSSKGSFRKGRIWNSLAGLARLKSAGRRFSLSVAPNRHGLLYLPTDRADDGVESQVFYPQFVVVLYHTHLVRDSLFNNR